MPLRYPGGKTRAIKFILPRLLPHCRYGMISPFLGGASIERALMSKRDDVQVHGNDIGLVYYFWNVLRRRSESLYYAVRGLYPLSKERYYELQSALLDYEARYELDDVERAAAFYAVNRASYSGRITSGFSKGHPRFTEAGISGLRYMDVERLAVSSIDAVDFLDRFRMDKLAYVDPPYAVGGKLYGEDSELDHVRLADCLKRRCNWVLSYNDTPEIRELYKDYPIEELRWSYSFANSAGKEQRQRVELLITDLD